MMMSVRTMRAACVASILAFAWVSREAHSSPIEEALQSRVDPMTERGSFTIGSTSIAATSFLAEVYERRAFHPAWERAGLLDSLLAGIEEARLDGLLPADYHLAELRARRDAP